MFQLHFGFCNFHVFVFQRKILTCKDPYHNSQLQLLKDAEVRCYFYPSSLCGVPFGGPCESNTLTGECPGVEGLLLRTLNMYMSDE
jgi:hypothetical protein